MRVFVLWSECGLNGGIIHGVYDRTPAPRVVYVATQEAKTVTGYVCTQVEDYEVQSACEGSCTRSPVKGTSWTDCHCYVNTVTEQQRP